MRLKELRSQSGKTQKEMAAFLGCTDVTYSRYETGGREPSIDTIKILAKYFGVN